jgi:hypothetical protein
MKKLSQVSASLLGVIATFLTIVLFPHLAQAQEAGSGFLNIANMVPAEKSVNISVMGKELVPGGLKSIDSTGWFIVPAGTHALSLACEGFKSAGGDITVNDNASMLYVIYLEASKQKVDKDNKPIPPQLRIKRCPALELKKSHYIEVMSVCPTEEPFVIGNNTILLEPFVSKEIPKWSGGAFTAQHLNKEIGSCAGSQEKGSYQLLIGTDHRGKYSSLLVRSETQELPPWMKKKEQAQKTPTSSTQP